MRKYDKAGRCAKCMTFILTDVVTRCLDSVHARMGGGTRLVTQTFVPTRLPSRTSSPKTLLQKVVGAT